MKKLLGFNIYNMVNERKLCVPVSKWLAYVLNLNSESFKKRKDLLKVESELDSMGIIAGTQN